MSHPITSASTTSAPAGARRHCLYCTARERAPCGGLRDVRSLDELDSVHDLPRRIASGTAIFNQGEAAAGAYTVLNGWIALTDTLADGRVVILHFILPGDLIPFELQGNRSTRSAIAVGDAIVCSFSRARHQRLLLEDRQYRERYQAAVVRDLHLAYDHFAEAMLSSAAERVLRLLWELSVRSLRRRPTASDLIPAPLSQIQIGMATGLTAVHVSRTLRQLRERGLLTHADHTITILDPPAVERLAGVSEVTMAMWT